MNYAQKALGRAMKALKAATQLRKAADAVCDEKPESVTFTAASGRTVTLSIRPENRPDFHTAADEVATQTFAREKEAADEVTRWAREVVLLADKEAARLAAARAELAPLPAAPAAAAPAPVVVLPEAEQSALAATMEPWQQAFLEALAGRGLAAAIQEAGINYNWADYCRQRVPAFAAAWEAAEKGDNPAAL